LSALLLSVPPWISNSKATPHRLANPTHPSGDDSAFESLELESHHHLHSSHQADFNSSRDALSSSPPESVDVTGARWDWKRRKQNHSRSRRIWDRYRGGQEDNPLGLHLVRIRLCIIKCNLFLATVPRGNVFPVPFCQVLPKGFPFAQISKLSKPKTIQNESPFFTLSDTFRRSFSSYLEQNRETGESGERVSAFCMAQSLKVCARELNRDKTRPTPHPDLINLYRNQRGTTAVDTWPEHRTPNTSWGKGYLDHEMATRDPVSQINPIQTQFQRRFGLIPVQILFIAIVF